MTFTVAQIASLVNGEVVGNPDVELNSPGRIEDAQKGQITFLADSKYEEFVYGSSASAVLVNSTFEPKQSDVPTLIKVDNVRKSVQILLDYYSAPIAGNGAVHKTADVSISAKIANGASIGKFSIVDDNSEIGENTTVMTQCYIGRNVSIGANCVFHAGVRIYDDCIIGDNVIIHSNAVIGCDGFGFVPSGNGEYQKVSQIGNVIIKNNVEIGSNTCIDRAVMGSTIIHRGVKLDNLIQVGHNVEIGEDTVIAAQTGIAGSTKIGKNCRVGGQVGFMGHIEVADGTEIQGQSGVIGNVKEKNSRLNGYPAMDFNSFYRSFAVFKQLPQILKDIRGMRKDIEKLK